jgi:hypothetical protein
LGTFIKKSVFSLKHKNNRSISLCDSRNQVLFVPFLPSNPGSSSVFTQNFIPFCVAIMESKSLKKGPFTEAWFKNFSFVINQGRLLWGLPFSFNKFSKYIFITYRGELKFKCLMTFFTLWILIYSSNYVHVIYWRSKEDVKRYSFCFCITFVDLIVYVLASVIFFHLHHICCLFNALVEYGREFNCKAYTFFRITISQYGDCKSLCNKCKLQWNGGSTRTLKRTKRIRTWESPLYS